jgi:lysophospholipase L1-like esterase
MSAAGRAECAARGVFGDGLRAAWPYVAQTPSIRRRAVTRPPASPSPRRRFGVRLAAAAVGVVAALAAAEIGLAIWTASTSPPLYRLDDRLGWVHAAGVDRALDVVDGRRVRFRTDARGLRATPHAEARTAGRRRVLFVGDSFTEGSQVEDDELFSRRVEAALPHVESWNAGVGGYSTLQVLLALPGQLAAWRPDLVVLTVFDNDLQDNLMPYFSGLGPRPYVQVRGEAVELVATAPTGPFERFLMPAPGALWLYEHSALYRALHKNLFLPSKGAALHALETQERAAIPAAAQRTAMAHLLAQVVAATRAGEAKLLVAAIPTREQAAAGDAANSQWLAERCAALAVPFCPLQGPLAAAGAANAYFDKDIHLTARGHEVVAAALLPPLREALR